MSKMSTLAKARQEMAMISGEAEASRVVEKVNSLETKLESIKGDLGSIKEIDDLLKSIRS